MDDCASELVERGPQEQARLGPPCDVAVGGLCQRIKRHNVYELTQTRNEQG